MASKNNLKYWATIYRGLGNPNRLRILELLNKKDQMSVTELSKELGITLKNTSRNLSILSNLGMVEFLGRQDKVYYSLNQNIEQEVKQIFKVTFQ